jgi:hypothetical protein
MIRGVEKINKFEPMKLTRQNLLDNHEHQYFNENPRFKISKLYPIHPSFGAPFFISLVA